MDKWGLLKEIIQKDIDNFSQLLVRDADKSSVFKSVTQGAFCEAQKIQKQMEEINMLRTGKGKMK